jgi:predicted aspartyl protease
MKFVLALICSFFISSSFGQNLDLNKGNFVNTDYFIELPFQKINNKIIVDVELGGKKRKFLMDTGAPMALSTALFNELNYTVLSKQTISDINQNKDSLLFVKIDRLKIGNEFITEIPAIVLANNILMDCLEIDGFIGSNALRNSVIQFDTKKQIITITNNSSKLKLDLVRANDIMLDQQSSPYLKFNIGEKISEFALFDSGSDEFYSMASEKIEKFRKAKDFNIIYKSSGSNTLGMTGFDKSKETSLMFIPFIKLNGVKIDNIISESNTDINSRIGVKMLDYGKLTLDYKNKKCFFEPYANNQEFENNQLQISLNFVDNHLCIGKIWTKELNQQIEIGYKVISINNSNVENMTICEAIKKPLFNGNSIFKIVVKKNNGELVTIDIEKIKRG